MVPFYACARLSAVPRSVSFLCVDGIDVAVLLLLLLVVFVKMMLLVLFVKMMWQQPLPMLALVLMVPLA